jgi:hypothetical protein
MIDFNEIKKYFSKIHDSLYSKIKNKKFHDNNLALQLKVLFHHIIKKYKIPSNVIKRIIKKIKHDISNKSSKISKIQSRKRRSNKRSNRRKTRSKNKSTSKGGANNVCQICYDEGEPCIENNINEFGNCMIHICSSPMCYNNNLFHKACIIEWTFRQHVNHEDMTCPICRSRVTPEVVNSTNQAIRSIEILHQIQLNRRNAIAHDIAHNIAHDIDHDIDDIYHGDDENRWSTLFYYMCIILFFMFITSTPLQRLNANQLIQDLLQQLSEAYDECIEMIRNIENIRNT